MLIKTIMLCALLTLIVACYVVAHADSGWPECNSGTATYNQADCIERAEAWKGVQAPYDAASTAQEAVELYQWATSAPRPLSGCTALGVAGEEWPGDRSAVCADYIPTPTATWTITPTPTPTVSPTATPAPTIVDDPIQYGRPWWLPIVASCAFGDLEYQGCGR